MEKSQKGVRAEGEFRPKQGAGSARPFTKGPRLPQSKKVPPERRLYSRKKVVLGLCHLRVEKGKKGGMGRANSQIWRTPAWKTHRQIFFCPDPESAFKEQKKKEALGVRKAVRSVVTSLKLAPRRSL